MKIELTPLLGKIEIAYTESRAVYMDQSWTCFSWRGEKEHEAERIRDIITADCQWRVFKLADFDAVVPFDSHRLMAEMPLRFDSPEENPIEPLISQPEGGTVWNPQWLHARLEAEFGMVIFGPKHPIYHLCYLEDNHFVAKFEAGDAKFFVNFRERAPQLL